MIGVGIIGASPVKSWAAQAHIPALAVLPEYELRAVSTSSAETARAAAAEYGVPAFDNHAELVARDDVDLVVVAVKVPTHLELASAAIAAGKHVLCEWPLGNGTAEAEQLAALAKARGVRGFVGLQAQASPQVRALKTYVDQGYVGRLVAVTLVGSGLLGGGSTWPSSTYLDDKANGANLLTIPIGHTLDALAGIVGEWTALSATAAIAWPEVRIDGGGVVARTSWDQIAIAGRIGDAVASVHYRGGIFPGTGLLLELVGTDGTLQLAGDMGHLQMSNPRLLGAKSGEALAELPLPAGARCVPDALPDGAPLNVGQNYAQIARDLIEGTRIAPDFDHAVKRHHMLDQIERAIAAG